MNQEAFWKPGESALAILEFIRGSRYGRWPYFIVGSANGISLAPTAPKASLSPPVGLQM